jgi:hypothetical protein
MNSALDALVEEWTPQLRSMRARWLADTAMKEADEASAAIRCYASEIQFRVIRGWPEVNDSDGLDLSRWRGYYVLGA